MASEFKTSEAERARKKRWNDANKERMKKIRADWKASNAEKVLEIRRKSAKKAYASRPELREKIKQGVYARSSANADGDTIEYALVVRNDPCSYCGKSGGTIDHVIPMIRGGENHWSNYTGACGFCNKSKNDTPLLQFMLRRIEDGK